MKKLVFAFVLSAAFAASAELKICTVDMLKLVKNHPSYETNKALLQSTEKDYQKKLDVLKVDCEDLQDQGRRLVEQSRNPMMAEAAKQKNQKDIQAMQERLYQATQKLQSEVRRSQQDLADLEARLLKTQTADIRKKVEDWASKQGYDLVLDASAAIYARPEFDVTDKVLVVFGVDPANARPADTIEKKADR